MAGTVGDSGTGAAAPAATAAPVIAVLAVHGVGEQKPGSTLRQIGGPLVALLTDTLHARGVACAVTEVSTLGDKNPHRVVVEIGEVGAPPSATIQVYESCWAAAFQPAGFNEMIGWMLKSGFRVLLAIGLAGWRGTRSSDRTLLGLGFSLQTTLRNLINAHVTGRKASVLVTAVDGLGLLIRMVLGVARLVLYVAGALAFVVPALLVLSVPVLIIALVLGAYWKATKRVTASVRSGLAASLGDAFTFEAKLIEREAMVRQVRLDLEYVRANGATEITVIAHSLGAAVTYDALVDEPSARARVTRLVTVGNALAVVGVAGRTHFNSTPNIVAIPGIEWTDFYTSFDPVPVGELGFTAPNEPNEPTPTPSSTRVSNEQSMIRDHSAYFVNAEEVMGVVVSHLLETCAPENSCLDFPSRLATAADLRHDRKNAQSALVMLFAAATFAAALTLSKAAAQDLGRRVYDLGNGLLGPLPDPLETPLKRWLQGSSPRWFMGALVVAFVGMVVYRLTVRTAWKAWDGKARNRLASDQAKLYDPAQLWYVLGVFIPIVAGAVGLGLRARYGLAMTHYTQLAVAGLVVTLVAELSIVAATHLTLKSKDLEPSGFARRVRERVVRLNTPSTPEDP